MRQSSIARQNEDNTFSFFRGFAECHEHCSDTALPITLVVITAMLHVQREV
jgi:hypothetical protein